MLSDLKLALRQLAKSPGFAVTAVVTLALGIGANAVVFSVLNALVLKPVNVPHAQNLYMVQRFQFPSQSYLDYVDLRDRNRTFESMMAFEIIGPVGVDSGRNPSTAWPFLASGNYFDALGIQPYLGRFYHASDEKGINSAPYVVLAYSYWHSYFHGDPHVVGPASRSISIPSPSLAWRLLHFGAPSCSLRRRSGSRLSTQPPYKAITTAVSRQSLSFRHRTPQAGSDAAEATADLNAIGAWLSKTYPSDDDGLKFSLARPGLVGDMLGGPARAFMAG